MKNNDNKVMIRAIERVISYHLVMSNKASCKSSREEALERIQYYLRDAKEIMEQYPKYKGKYMNLYNKFSKIYQDKAIEEIIISDGEEELQKYDELLQKRRKQQSSYNLKYALKHGC